ncbi:hypothetical protein [Streptomyces sp. NPDC048603]|uniref:hypothetical protein n=1 Tax=Streptomyces sp. NPDC048603 TaxID=3365577 RepID=UPI003714F270
MIRRTSAALLAAASLFGAGVAMAAPAQAYNCTWDNVCLHSDSDFNGLYRDDFSSRPNWSQITYYGGQPAVYQGDYNPDNVSSINNMDPDSRVSVFYNSGYAGPCFKIADYGRVKNMASIYITSTKQANDNMNSHRFGDSCLGSTYNF